MPGLRKGPASLATSHSRGVQSHLASLGCSSAPPPQGPEMVGESADALTDWSLFPTGDQCLVAIQQFYKRKFGVSVPVARNSWTGSCGTDGRVPHLVDDIPSSALWEADPQ